MNILAKSLLFFGLLLVSATTMAQTQANAIDKYFQQYVDDDRFTVVYISPKLFEMLGKLDIDGLDMEDDAEAKAILDIAQDLQGLRILVSEEDASGLYEEAKQKIDTREYEVLMTVRNKKEENVEFLVKEADGIISELLLLVGGDEFVLLSFVGKLSLEDISKLARAIDER